jgi:hypothetical protein
MVIVKIMVWKSFVAIIMNSHIQVSLILVHSYYSIQVDFEKSKSYSIFNVSFLFTDK